MVTADASLFALRQVVRTALISAAFARAAGCARIAESFLEDAEHWLTVWAHHRMRWRERVEPDPPPARRTVKAPARPS